MALTVVVALTLVAFTACGGDNEETTTPSTSTSTTATTTTDMSSGGSSAAAPDPTAAAASTATDAMLEPVVDVVVIGAIAPGQISNNVGRGLGVQDHIQVKPMYEYMIGTDPVSGALVPQLAESWSIEPNGVDFHITLREGIPFHNDMGTVSYRDVEFTVNEFGNEESIHTHSRNYRTVQIDPVSDLEFIWKLPGPLAEQERRMSEHIGGMEIMSVADYEALGEENITPRGGGFEYMEISDLVHQVQATMGEDAQNVILRQIGDIAFPSHVAVNLFYIPPQLVLNPDVVESWNWPGNIAGLWSHFDQIRAVKK